jgi:hypothetical protein
MEKENQENISLAFLSLQLERMLSDNNAIKLKLNKTKVSGKSSNIWKLNKVLVSNQWFKEEITKEIRKYFVISENEITTY